MHKWSGRLFVVMTVLVVVATLFVLLDPNARVHGWLRREPFFAGRSATSWGRILGSFDANERSIGAQELRAGKADSVPVLTSLLKSDSCTVRLNAADTLARMGSEANVAGGSADRTA